MQIYMLGGKARSGKDTIASFIKEEYENQNKKCVILQISTYLKYYAMKVLGWQGNEEDKPREFLQESGTTIRKNMGEDFFIKRIVDDIKILSNYVDVIIVSDVRFPIEYEAIKDKFSNVKRIYVTRDNFDNNLGKNSMHATETSLDNFKDYDVLIQNDGTIESLKEKIKSLIKGDTENEKIKCK